MNNNANRLLNNYLITSKEYYKELKKESNSENWEKVRLLLARKRKEIISIIENDIGVNIADRIDYTGSPYISDIILQNSNLPISIKDLLHSSNFLLDKGNIFSRGHSYYFLYDGLSYEENGNPLIDSKIKVADFNPSQFYTSVEKHITGIFNAFEEISHIKEGEVDNEVILKINLILLDQLKNLILFSLNFCLHYFDPKFFGKNTNGERIESVSILNTQELRFLEVNSVIPVINKKDQISINEDGEKYYGRIIETFFKELSYIESNFASLILQNTNENFNLLERDYVNLLVIEKELKNCFTYLKKLFQSIEESEKGGRNFANTIRNKIIKKLIRHNREEDNFLFMLQTSIDNVNLIQSYVNKENSTSVFTVDNNDQNIHLEHLELICPLYGGIEMPFILKIVGEKFLNDVTINIRLIAYSYYDLKNANAGIDISEYPMFNNKLKDIREITDLINRKIMKILNLKVTWGLILDDNVYTGRTLNDFYTRFKSEYPKLLIATTASKTQGSKAVNYEDTKSLLKKVIPTTGYSIPDKNGKNGIVYSIGKRLKNNTKLK